MTFRSVMKQGQAGSVGLARNGYLHTGLLALVCVAALGFGRGAEADGNHKHILPDSGRILGASGGNINYWRVIDGGITQCATGTLGVLVQSTGRRGKKVEYVLSNNHVLARTNLLNGDGTEPESAIQPGLVDQDPKCSKVTQTAGANVVGELSDYVKLAGACKKLKGLFEGSGAYICGRRGNEVDAAIAEVALGSVSPEIQDIGPICDQYLTYGDLSLNMDVQKSGRTTGLTSGKIAEIDVVGAVLYNCWDQQKCSDGERVYYFVNQVTISWTTSEPFAAGGDSGSLVVSDDGKAVGLVFAGSSSRIWANPIDAVFEAFGVAPVGSSSACGVPVLSAAGSSGDDGNGALGAAFAVPVDLFDLEHARDVHSRHSDALLACAASRARVWAWTRTATLSSGSTLPKAEASLSPTATFRTGSRGCPSNRS